MAQPVLQLPPTLDAFVDEQVRSGAYPDRDSVIADALDMLREHTVADEESDEVKLARLNAKLQQAIDSLDRGEGIRVHDTKAHFDGIMERVKARVA
ncbi:type II toxin-antitoxin system ParD family antitoxin [Brevundimonas sp.]|jgi:putative addiction module CopG family antidote|uniref:ribbon-helix-helix domain-containing protein n=1 Tax=Brevundimonas sp. TaxID=1871086 RepID=UPI0037835E30